MTYTPQTWINGSGGGTPVSAARLTVMENGIAGAETFATAAVTAAQLAAINSQSGTSYTLVLADAGKSVEMTNAAANTVAVPPNSSVAFAVGTVTEIVQMGAGQTTVVAGSGVTVNTASSLLTRTRYSSLTIRKQSTNVWLLAGDAA